MIPYNTDAPLYHTPAATLGLAVLGVLLFLVVPPDPEEPSRALDNPALPPVVRVQNPWNEPDPVAPAQNQRDNRVVDPPANNEADADELIVRLSRPNLFLHFGTINPLQWVTSPLLHKSFAALTVNLIGLWALGLVIEGRIGPARFLALFFSIAISHAALVQILLFFVATGSTAGYAPAVTGLLGVAIVWLPRNTYEVWFGSLLGTKEISILIYGFLVFVLIMFASALGGESAGEWVIPLPGLLFGIGFGFLWLLKGWVDCEGWDLLTVLKGKEGNPNHAEEEEVAQAAQSLIAAALPSSQTSSAPTPAGEKDARPLHARTHRRSKPVKQKGPKPSGGAPLPPTSKEPDENNPLGFPQAHDPIQDVALLLEQDNLPTALKLLEKIRIDGNRSRLAQPALNKLIRLMLAAQNYREAIPHMSEHIERFEEQREKLQLSLAKLLLHQERPQRALAVLGDMDETQMDKDARTTRSQLVAHAKVQIDQGIIEFSD